MKHALTKFEVIHIIKYILKGENNDTIKRRYKTTIPSVYICFVIMCPQSLYLPQLWIEWSTTSLTAYNELLLLWLGGIALVVKDMYTQAVVFLRVAHNDIVCQFNAFSCKNSRLSPPTYRSL